MVLPKTYPRPSQAPLGVGSGVWVHDQLRKLEDILERLRLAEMNLAQMDQLERALMKAHEVNVVKARRRLEVEGE